MSQAQLYEICKHFQGKPVEYAEIVLGVHLTDDQKHILRLLTQPPYKVLVRSANTQGKSFVAGVAALYSYDCFNPSITIVTAPVFRQVTDIIFKEIRTLGRGREGFSPKSPMLFDHPKHQIVGITSTTATAFQGIHDATVSIIADEIVGIDGSFIEAMEAMLGGHGWFWLGLFNPTDTSSWAYTAERSGKYHLVVLNALKHPNIVAELAGQPPPVEHAIRLDRLREMLDLWCEPVQDGLKPEDFEFDGRLYRPGPVAESRLLGRWPSQAASAIWTEALFDKCCELDCGDEGTVQIGCDVAVFGDDDTFMAVRKGRHLVYLEGHNGWSPLQTAARLKELSLEYRLNPNQKPPIVIDEGGVGVSVSCQGEDFNFVGLNFASKAIHPLWFRNKRDELHFTLADMAKAAEVSFKRLPRVQQEVLRLELLAPTYSLDYQGRRVVEKKIDIKKRLGKSPDAADAVLLAFYPVDGDEFQIVAPEIRAERRKLGF